MDKGIKLYPHNLKGYTKVKEAYESGEKVVGIVHATGTGKTYISLQLCLDNPDKKTLFVVPSNAIIEHIMETISECGLSLERDFPNLQFATYQSLTTKTDEELASMDIDMLVLDEFHHIGAPVWGEQVNKIVDSHPDMKVFGMTAYTVRDRGTSYERDMALPGGNELFSDKIVSTYDVYDAMCDGVLPIPNYKSAYLNLLDELITLEDEILDSNDIPKNNKIEYLNILKSCKEQIDKAPKAKDLIKQNLISNDKCIYFCPVNDSIIVNGDEILGTNDVSSIRHRIGALALEVSGKTILYETTSDMGEAGKMNRDHFYNDTSFFRNEDVSNILRIMFAKNQYNEGVHAPGVTKVFMARQTNSDIVFFEQLGRALSVRGNIIELTNEYELKDIDELKNIANEQGIDISKCNSKEEIIERLLAPTIVDLVGNIEFIRELKDNLKERLKERQENGIHTKITRVLVDSAFDITVENEDIYNILNDVEKDVLYSPNDLIEEYIEMLADDRITEIKSGEDITFYIGDKTLVRTAYWSEHYPKIRLKLLEDKYKDSKYDKVRDKIALYEKKSSLNSLMIEEYIEMLADDRIKEIVAIDDVKFDIDGLEVFRKKFWQKNKEKIIEKFTELKYKDSKYDIVRKKIEFNFKKKNITDLLVEQYIEKVASNEISRLIGTEKIIFDVDGNRVERVNFLLFNVDKIVEKLNEDKYKDSRYDIVKEKIKTFNDRRKDFVIIDKNVLIEEYIEMLADGRITEIIGHDDIVFNIDNKIITRTAFWQANKNSVRIKEKLKEQKYKDSKYDKVRDKIKNYEEKTDKSVTPEMIIEEYIEMLADDRIPQIKASEDITFIINDRKITYIAYWGNNSNSAKIKKKLQEEKYKNSRYDKVREKINNYYEEKEKEKGYSADVRTLYEEYIEMLVDDRIPQIKASEDITFNINGESIERKNFWRVGLNSKRIIDLLESDKYKDSKYDIAREKLKKYKEKNTANYSIDSNRLINEYIEMLADGRIDFIKSSEDITFIIDGKPERRVHFWVTGDNQKKIREKLASAEYSDSKYDIVREKVIEYDEKNKKNYSLSRDKIIEEYIEMLADGRINTIGSSEDITFNIDGVEEVRVHFWSNNLKKIIEKIKEEKYQDDKYSLARLKIKAAQNKKINTEYVENLCIEYNIDFKKNKKYIERVSYKILSSILRYLSDNNIPYLDNKGILVSDIFMSSKDFESKYGISIIQLLSNEKRL